MSNDLQSARLHTGRLAVLSGCLAAAILAFYLLTPAEASPEYRYTAQKIFQFGFMAFFLLCIICVYVACRNNPFIRYLESTRGAIFACCIGTAFIIVPVISPPAGTMDWRIGICLSLCWLAGTFCMALGLFLLAIRLNNLFSSILCLFGTLFLIYFVGEFACLITPQTRDGRWTDGLHSKYVLSGQATPQWPKTENMLDIFPNFTTGPHALAHREMKNSNELFDALYSFNDKNRRLTPPSDSRPKADLLLFGCSFTFGHGLDDEQTWAWQLAKKLGPEWKVENYALNGFGAQQMLLILEEKKFDPPTAPIRQALFLAIHDQIRRNSGLMDVNSVTYKLAANGQPVRNGLSTDDPRGIVFKIPAIFNGSQFAREVSLMFLSRLVNLSEQENIKIYLAMLEKSAKILWEDYKTSLTVLLWPDIENIAPELEKRGIHFLHAAEILIDWKKLGEKAYQIVPEYETHPNTKATRELAAGLASYYHSFE